jgi:hypothetical protein
MAIKFASILAVLGLGSTTEAVTEAHLEAADAKIAQLEEDKKTAELKVEKAAADLKTAQDEKAKTEASLKTAEDKAATLEEWKKNQAIVDGRDEDESNSLDKGAEATEPWEKASAAAISNTKKRLGDK